MIADIGFATILTAFLVAIYAVLASFYNYVSELFLLFKPALRVNRKLERVA